MITKKKDGLPVETRYITAHLSIHVRISSLLKNVLLLSYLKTVNRNPDKAGLLT